MLLLELERALFKFNAPTPPLEVLLKFDPRNGTANPYCKWLIPVYKKLGQTAPVFYFFFVCFPLLAAGLLFKDL